MKQDDIILKLKEAGVRNLTEFGYDGVTTENITKDTILRKFFASMLNDNLGHGTDIDAAIHHILSEMEVQS